MEWKETGEGRERRLDARKGKLRFRVIPRIRRQNAAEWARGRATYYVWHDELDIKPDEDNVYMKALNSGRYTSTEAAVAGAEAFDFLDWRTNEVLRAQRYMQEAMKRMETASNWLIEVSNYPKDC